MKSFRTLLSHPKDHILDDDKSNVVYKVNCHDCDASYVGKTKSTEDACVEKKDLSDSALAQHARENNQHIDWTSACVLGVESHYHSRQAIHICRQSSSLNRDGVPYLIYMTT